jgi:ATP-dependent Clp protease, protease subunit
MTLRTLPTITNLAEPDECESLPPLDGFEHWFPDLRIRNDAAEASGSTVIDIFDQIGKDPWTGEGVSAQEIAGQLKGASNVVVNINSLGGSFYEGTTIYNLLNSHQGSVIVNVLGMAASAASIIAMAGDEVNMGPAAFMMIHNAQGATAGDRHDHANSVTNLTAIDYAIRDLYVARTGKHANSISQMMDAETLMNAADAIKFGFADKTIDKAQIFTDPTVTNEAKPLHARRWADAVFAHAGVPRSQRRMVYAAIKAGPNDPVLTATQAGIDSIRRELELMRGLISPGAPANGAPDAANSIKPGADLSSPPGNSAPLDTQNAVETVAQEADLRAVADELRQIFKPS